MWEKFKEIWWNVSGILALAWVLMHLILIEIYGKVQLYEDNPYILWIEIIYTGSVIFLGIERLIKDIKK